MISPPYSPAPKTDKNHGIAIGAGVGVPLGLIALSVIGFLLWRNWKLNRALRRDNSRIPSMRKGIEEPNDNGVEYVKNDEIEEREVLSLDEAEWKGRATH